MTPESQRIHRLIKAISKNQIVFFPFVIWDEHFEGIRVNGTGYELFQVMGEIEGMEELPLHCSELYREDEILIQRILEQILIEME